MYKQAGFAYAGYAYIELHTIRSGKEELFLLRLAKLRQRTAKYKQQYKQCFFHNFRVVKVALAAAARKRRTGLVLQTQI